MTLTGLARSLLLRGPFRLAALVLCLAATFAVAWALPLTEAVALRSGLREQVSKGAHLTVERPDALDFDGFTAFQREAAGRVEERMGSFLRPGTALAVAGPLLPVSVNDRPPAGQAGDMRLAAAYRDELAVHVEVVAGELPPDGLGGVYPAVTMPQEGADQAGLHLSDRLCVDFAAGPSGRDPRWCARLVGLWRPMRASDPYWAGSPPRLELALGRYDFFELLKLHPPQVTAGRRYAVDLSAVDPGSAPVLAQRVDALRGSFGGGGRLKLVSSVGAALDRYDAAQRPAALTLNVLVAALALLALCLVQLTASRMVDVQARDVALLRLRGWPPAAAWRFLFVQLVAAALAALPLGLFAAALVTTALGVGVEGRGPAPGDVAAAGGALLGVVAGVLIVLAVVAWSVAGRNPGDEPTALGPAAAWWRRWNIDLPLAGLALALVLTRPARPGSLLGAAPADDLLGFLAPVLAVAILGLVALRALPAAARVAGRGRTDLPATLAGWQLGRRPEQHAGLVFFLILALTTAGFSALNLAILPRAIDVVAAIHRGRDGVLIAVLLAALTMAVAAFGLHFRAVARARRREYAVLALHGLPAGTVDRSLGIEQVVVLVYGVAAGTLLALLLAATLQVHLMGAGVTAEAADVVEAVLGWAALPAGLVGVGWLVRRAGAGGDPLEALRRVR